jgi:small subunit ribosomal protein S6
MSMSDSSASTPPSAPAAPAGATATAPAPAPVQPLPVLPPGVRLYEAMWVVDANTGREDYNKVLAGLKEVVEKGGGTWINADKWEERRLAYSIKKKKRGLYIINHFSAATESITKIDRNARLSDLVLRHMITVDEDGLSTSPPVRAIDDDDFGGGGGDRGGRSFGGGDRGGGRSFGGGGDRPRSFGGGRDRDSGAGGPGATSHKG